MALFHICPRDAWEATRSAYCGDTLDTDGFVHCSTIDQVRAVADAVFEGEEGLVLLGIDQEELNSDVRWEDGFPHVFGPIERAAVVEVIDFPSSEDGTFELPWEAAALLRDEPTTLAELRERVLGVMDGFERPWWVSGGWALDVWHGSVSRPHEDLDVAIVRRDVPALREHLRDWDLRVPNPEVPFVELPFDGTFDAEQHQIWARRRDDRVPAGRIEFSADPTWFDMLVEDAEGDEWIFRREPAIRRPLELYGAVSGDGLPYVRPEVQLLYKSRRHPERPTLNDEDLDRALPDLEPEDRAWLREAVRTLDPNHEWLQRI